jgi:hypothetical protein
MKAICAGCHEPVEIPDPAAPEFLNNPNTSVLIIQHPNTGYCFNCKTSVALFLRGAQLALEAKPTQAKSQSPIVLAQADALRKVKQ